jgi:O-antigen/teichoic acid export membrane protein
MRSIDVDQCVPARRPHTGDDLDLLSQLRELRRRPAARHGLSPALPGRAARSPVLIRRLWERRLGLLAAGLRLTGALMQVLTAVVVARVAEPAHASQFFIGFAAVTLIAVLGRAGYDQALTKFVAGELALHRPQLARESAQLLIRRFLQRMCWMVPPLLAGLGAAWLGLDHAHYGELSQALIPFVLAAPFLGLASLAGVALQAAGRPLLSVCSMFFIHNIVTLSVVLIPAASRPAWAFNVAFLLGCLCAALAGSVFLRRTLHARMAVAGPSGGTEPVDSVKTPLFALARENAWTVVGNLILTWSPMTLVGALTPALDAARFGIASRSAQLVSFALPALNFVLAPRFAALRATGEHAQLRRALLGSTALSLSLSSVVALPIILLADRIMAFFGPAYVAAAPVLILLALAQWANGAAGAAIQFLAMTGKERALRRIFLSCAAMALAIGPVLTWRFGSIGAAALALGSSLMLNVLCIVTALRSSKRPAPLALPQGAPQTLHRATVGVATG